MKAKKEEIVFAGDSTWTSLFKSLFKREYPNTDSLFVNDFYEGDKNVTKALKIELEKTDWKMLILREISTKLNLLNIIKCIIQFQTILAWTI